MQKSKLDNTNLLVNHNRAAANIDEVLRAVSELIDDNCAEANVHFGVERESQNSDSRRYGSVAVAWVQSCCGLKHA